MSIAVIDYSEEEMRAYEKNSRAKDFIENVILQNLEENDKILITITDDGVICMPKQFKIAENRIESGIMAQVFHLAKRYGISSKMILANQNGDMLCEFW